MLISFLFPVHAEGLRVGTTFSPVQCGYLGQDWKKTYIRVLGMGFDIVRLGAYWAYIEKAEGVYDFSDLDWQIKEAEKRGIPVILTVGMKAPRWPEYFIPGWALERASLRFGQDMSGNAFVKRRALMFIKEVVNRYGDRAIIECWQVENEPLDRSGPKYRWIGKRFLTNEVSLVRRLDRKKRPVVINMATYPNRFLRVLARITSLNSPLKDAVALCDILAINVYPAIGYRLFRFETCFRTVKDERLAYFSEIVKYAKSHGKKVWVTEVQAEPWEPGVAVFKGPGDPVSVKPSDMKETFDELASLGIDTILLWGAEYWLYRNDTCKDPRWLTAARSILSRE